MAELYVDEARAATAVLVTKLRNDLADTHELVAGKACAYATGSFGRLEASKHSDLDVLVVVDTTRKDNGEVLPLLDGIEETKLKCRLIKLVEDNDIRKFDAGGKYLASHTIDSFTDWLGSNEDDYRNTLTARMLMLLESKCLIGDEVYDKANEMVIRKYFRDFADHRDNFVPAFLLNDILRMWRTFCVQYEFHRKKGQRREKIKNLKLKFSRMLTCYSAVIYLLCVFSNKKTVLPTDIREMVAISPTERLESLTRMESWRGVGKPAGIEEIVRESLTYYSDFLELTHRPPKNAARAYGRNEQGWREKSYAFGGTLVRLIDLIGETSDEASGLRRLILI